MKKDEIIEMANKAFDESSFTDAEVLRFAKLVAAKEREQILFAIKEVRGRSQEPVAWMFQHEETGRTVCIDAQQLGWGFEKGNPRLKKIAPLYTTPPHRPWVGLTDEERNAIFELHHTRLGGWDYRGDEVMYDEHFEDATVAIYAKLKQKNGIKE